MNRHALEVLELPRVLALVAGRAASEPGREAVLAREPGTDPEALRRELERVAQTMAFLQEKAGWGPPTIPDARATLRRLAVKGSFLEPVEVHRLGVLLASGRELGRELDGRAGDHPALGSLRERLHEHPELEEAIVRTVEADGSVLDTASRELKRIRGELKRAHSRIVQKLESYMRTLPERVQVGDASVTIREGRYVIPVRREGKGEVGGFVHDESGTGATVFVEPPIAIRLMNELRDLERDEQREIQRILRELTGRLAPEADALTGSQEALVDFDSLHARARMATEWRATKPELLAPGSGALEVVGGRHPLLLAKQEDVVPFDLRLEPGERAMVVSGPNTGGKSVFLKALGLAAALAQSGFIPPVRAGTRLPVFGGIFADIGDEQSIAESLSTFSAHLENLKEIVAEADGTSLVLIDEMGTGTDPMEGAALARAILETLVERGALSVVTSHLGQLKTLDTDGSGVVNASLQFDPDRMEPTYRLVKGRPGRSYGLAIARRLGFPTDVMDRAEGHVSQGEASVEDLLETLERKEKEAETLVADLARERTEATRLREELQDREAELRRQERTAERRSREEARRLLMDAREEVEDAIREVRSAADAEGDVDEASRRARRRVEEAARRQKERKPGEAAAAGEAPELAVGQRVRLPGGGQKGVVAGLKGGRAVVEVGGLRMELPAADLEAVPHQGGGAEEEGARRTRATAAAGAARDERSAADRGGWSGPETDPSSEVDLRGYRVEEVELELGRALDAAVVGGLSDLLIIHGKGTGAVRARVQELLEIDRRVKEFRLGRPGEGGAGVTVARVG
ncbi:MAG: endonuclease MutS2 [Gemmatimonadetes bacterium]|nr:endonuclease MutS2 [Gemmatimonadota bacterium]